MAEKRNVCWFLWKISISVRDPLGRRLHGYDPGVAGQFDSRQNGGGGLGLASSGSYSLEHRKCFATEYENKCFLSDRFWHSLSLFPSVFFLPNEYIPWQPNNDSVAMTMGTNKKCQSNRGKLQV